MYGDPPPSFFPSVLSGFLKVRRSQTLPLDRESTERVKYLAQEHNTMIPACAQTRTARSEVQLTKYLATGPLIKGGARINEVSRVRVNLKDVRL